jgi:5-methylcytosine-specific restriction protein B
MSKYNPNHSVQSVLAAADRWAHRCLISDGSVFTDEDLWAASHFEELDRVYVQNPLEEGNKNFLEKLEEQLQPAAPASRRLMAEVLWALMLFPTRTLPATKRENVRTVWSWSGTQLDQQHEMLSDEVLKGIGATGAAYNTQRWREVSFLIGLVRSFKRASPGERATLLNDPWQFVAWMDRVPEGLKRQFRHILAYMLYPDQFERISTGKDKRAIASAFSGKSKLEIAKLDKLSIDRILLDVRHQLETASNAPIDFYEGEAAEKWKEPKRSWLLSWNPSNWHWDSLEADRASTVRGGNVVHSWRCASLKPQEGDHAYLLRTGEPPKGIIAYGTIIKAGYEAPHYDPEKAREGQVANFVDVAFSAIRDAVRDPIVALDQLERGQPEQTWNPQASGIQILPQAAKLLATLWQALPSIEKVGPIPPPAQARNLVLYGPPGTGKTHRLLTRFVPTYEDKTSTKVNRRYEFVTFHQSFAYEDFVEGIRPKVEEGGSIAYEVKPGVFRRLCERAKEDPGRRYAIFIDEINRGNLAKIFGELITLLEPDKRTKYASNGITVSGLEVTLPYSGDRFGVPENIDVFGTMNTADRSIALLDIALRRRFEFEELVPTAGALTGRDGDGLIDDGNGGEIDLRQLLEAMNRRLAYLLHRDQTIGHAYLMKVSDFDSLKRVMSREIIPLLQEYFYEDWRRICLVLGDHAQLEPRAVQRSQLNFHLSSASAPARAAAYRS